MRTKRRAEVTDTSVSDLSSVGLFNASKGSSSSSSVVQDIHVFLIITCNLSVKEVGATTLLFAKIEGERCLFVSLFFFFF